jgi:pimeloyl-ACP methyl ester carboxylesterase
LPIPANPTRGASPSTARYDPLVPIEVREHTLLIWATEADLPPAVATALRAPTSGEPGVVRDRGIPWATISWGALDDPPMLLVHGITSAAGVFWRLGPALAATGRRVIAVDLPGHGDTGTWQGRHRHAETSEDLAGFIRAAGLDLPEVTVLGHSWGGMVVSGLPKAGIRPRTLILLDPPALDQAALDLMLEAPTETFYESLAEARAAVRDVSPGWSDGDVEAKAIGLTKFDPQGALRIMRDNGEWDAGVAALSDASTSGVAIWYIRGESRTGGLIAEDYVPKLAAMVGADRVLTIAGGPHSPMRTHPEATVLAILRALDG